jgi:hypothetical protein
MEIERERGISVATSVMTFEYEGPRLQPARHAGPRGLFRRHLSHAHGGGFRGHGDRRSSRRSPDAIGKTTLTEKLLLFGGAINLAGQVKAKRNRRTTRSDWMEIERERGISVATSVMTFEYEGPRLQPARHAGPRGLFRRHLSHAHGGGFRGHGDRRREGHRVAHAQAL